MRKGKGMYVWQAYDAYGLFGTYYCKPSLGGLPRITRVKRIRVPRIQNLIGGRTIQSVKI